MSNPLRIVVADRPPLVFINNGSAGVTYTGMLIDLWQRIVAASNGTLSNYEYYTSPSNVGGVLADDGNWTGIVGELVYGHADLALFPLTRVQFRLDVIDASYSFLDQGLTLLVRNGVEQPGALSVLAPFEMTLWVLLLCTVISVSLLFWGLDAYGRWIRRKQAEALRASGVLSQREADRIKRENWSSMLISFAAAAGAPERPSRSSWGVQVLYVVYCFFCLIVLSSYTANLTSFLAVRRATVLVNGLQDIVNKDLLLATAVGSVTAAYFASSQDTLALQLGPHVRYCAADTCLQWLRDGTVAAYVGDAPVLDYIAGQQPCDLTTVGDPFGPGNLVVGLPKTSTLLPIINRVIQRFSEDGTLTSLRRAWFDNLSQCTQADALLDSSKLTISQMLGAFAFLAMGVVAAFITGTVENLKWCIARAYKSTDGSAARGDEPVHHTRDASMFNRLHVAILRSQKKHLQASRNSSASAGGGCPLCGQHHTTGVTAAAAATLPEYETTAAATANPANPLLGPLQGEMAARQAKSSESAHYRALGPMLSIGDAARRLGGSADGESPRRYRLPMTSLPPPRDMPPQPYQQPHRQEAAQQQQVAPRAPSTLVSEVVDVGCATQAPLYGGGPVSLPVPVVMSLPEADTAATRMAAAAVVAAPVVQAGALPLGTAASLPVPAKPQPGPPSGMGSSPMSMAGVMVVVPSVAEQTGPAGIAADRDAQGTGQPVIPGRQQRQH